MKTSSTINEKFTTKTIYTVILVGFFLYSAGYVAGQALWYFNHNP